MLGIVKVVYLQNKASGGYTILLSTDTDMEAGKIMRYYSLRLQI
ncbi:hypothetical protein [Chitinophaga sp. OAE865]